MKRPIKSTVSKPIVTHICYICEKVIKGNYVYIGQNEYRHKMCRPGSAHWKKSKGKKYTDLYYNNDKKEN